MWRRVWVNIFWLIPRTCRASCVKRSSPWSDQHFEDDHRPLVGHLPDQVVDQRFHPRIALGRWGSLRDAGEAWRMVVSLNGKLDMDALSFR